mgnify:CR=1 FL=1
MELSPKADFVPFFKYPRVDDAGVRRLKRIAGDAGRGHRLRYSLCCVGLVRTKISDRPPYAPGSEVIQITVDLGVEVINSEFNGRPEAPGDR